MKTAPLLAVGTFGVHIIDTPSGKFTFVGSVPASLFQKSWQTEEEARGAFMDWFKSLPFRDQQGFKTKLRADIFDLVYNQ